MQCSHVNAMDQPTFRALIRGKFMGEGQRAPAPVPGTASAVAAAAAPYTGKDRVTLTTIAHCETCAEDSKSEQAIATVKDRAERAALGDICYDDLWLCMHCGKICCLSTESNHALEHVKTNPNHCLLLQCHDSHVFCTKCRIYVYPRELAGTSIYERKLDNIVYQWLLMMGRLRLWWRVLDKVKPTPTMRGIQNFGNTCFFTSTCQALIHNETLQKVLNNHHEAGKQEKAIQQELRKLSHEYATAGNRRDLNPRPFFRAMQQNALFGQYSDSTMEDSSSLMTDILCGMDEKLVERLFNITFGSGFKCTKCDEKKKKAEQENNNDNGDKIEESNLRKSTECYLSLALADFSDLKATQDAFGASAASSSLSPQQAQMKFDMIINQSGPTPTPLKTIIDNYFVSEDIPDYRCSGCNERGGVSKQTNLLALPEVLLLQLKRFAPNLMLGAQLKCHRKILLPETLDLAYLLSDGTSEEDKENAYYTLSALVVHDGGMGGGHNMCYVRNSNHVDNKGDRQENKAGTADGDGAKDNQNDENADNTTDKNNDELGSTDDWTWYSDSFYGPVSRREVDLSEPYLVFYERAPRPTK